MNELTVWTTWLVDNSRRSSLMVYLSPRGTSVACEQCTFLPGANRASDVHEFQFS